jgi:predicted Zn-dependent peptidase
MRADIEAFHRRWFHPKNFVIAVNGDFDSAAMTARLEKLFAAWPFTGEVPPPVPTEKKFAAPGVYLVDKEVNQGRVTILLPGIRRDDPDFQAAQVMNDILGGGGFTSRIMNRVRSDEGLAYSAGSGFPGGVYHPMSFLAAFQSK